MAIKTKTKIIKDHKYTTSYIPARQASVIAYRLMGIFSSGGDAFFKLHEMDKDGSMILEILSHTIRDDMAINEATFDNIYTGNLAELIEAVKFVVEVNFADFLPVSDIGSLSAEIKTPKAKSAEV